MARPDTDSSDRDLLAAIARGEQRALASLFSRHNLRVFRYLMRIVDNRATAEDLLNEVFMQIWTHAGRYEGRSAPTTWMLSIAHNRAVSALRRTRVTEELDEETMGAIADEGDIADVVIERADSATELAAAIGKLSPEHRTIIDLVYYQERSVAEAAEILDIPEATVKTRMFYARKKLATLVRR